MVDRGSAAAVQSRRSVQNVQALRAIAAIMVVGAHIGGSSGVIEKVFGRVKVWDNLAFVGSTGVDLFFVISGFIMVVTTARSAHGSAGSKTFLRRRITRIYPAYFLITLLIYAVYLVKPDFVNSSQSVRPSVVASFLLLPQAGLPLLLVGWTLVYEMYFYLIFSAGLLLPKRFFPYVLGIWGLVTLLLNLLVHGSNAYLGLVASPLNFEFLFGAILGWLFLSGRIRAPKSAGAVGILGALTVYTFVMLGHQVFTEDAWVRVFTTGVALLIVAYAAIGAEQRGTLLPGPLAKLGDSSYSLYLTHVAVLKVFSTVLAHLHLSRNLGLEVFVALAAVAVAIACGLGYYRLVEKPLLRIFHDGRRRPVNQLPSPAALDPVP